MDRVYSTIQIKRVSEDERIIEGIATTPTPDRMQDVVEPLGGKFVTPLPLLLDHDSRQAVGQVIEARATSAGIEFKARIAKIAEPGAAKDLVDSCWQLVKAKLRAAVSIGFRPFPGGVEVMSTGGLRYKSWEWLELSLVAVPAQAEAQIFSAKSLGDAAREIRKHDHRKSTRPPVRLDGNRSRVVRLDGPSGSAKSGRVVRLSRFEKLMLAETKASQRRRDVFEAAGIKTTRVVRLTASDIARARRGR